MQKIFWLFSLGILLSSYQLNAGCLLDMTVAFYHPKTSSDSEVIKYQNLLKIAEKFQAEKHKNQKHGKLMFTDHVDHIRRLLKEFGYRKDNVRDLKIYILAELHDTREDTGATYQEILELFGEEIAEGVESLTYTHGLSRQEQYEEKLPLWKNYTLAAVVKHLDRIANFETSIQEAFLREPPDIFWYKRYKSEWAQFFRRNEEIIFSDPRDIQVFNYLKSLFESDIAVNNFIGYPRQSKIFNQHIEKAWEEIKKD